MCNYYRTFVKDYSKISLPLNRLLQKNVKFIWTEKLSNKLYLHLLFFSYPDVRRNFILTCDASTTVISYILGQLDDEEEEHAKAYGGRSLTNAERKWSTSE